MSAMDSMLPLDPLEVPLAGVRLIEASAGTGKTYTIATLYLRLLLERGLSVRQILVVTFTKAATEELRDRIRARLRDGLAALRGAVSDDDPQLAAVIARVTDREVAATRIADELTCLDEAAVFTIHGFCQRMLQENAFESGMLFEAELTSDEVELLGEVTRDFWRRSFYGCSEGMALLARATWSDPEALLKQIRSWIAQPDLTLLPEIGAQPGALEAAFIEQFDALSKLWRSDRETVLRLIADADGLSRAKEGYKPDAVSDAAVAFDAWVDAPPDPFLYPPGFQLFTAQKLADSVTPSKRDKGVEPPQHPLFDRCDRLFALREQKQVQLTCEAIAWCRAELARRKRERGLMAFDDLLSDLRTALDTEGGERLAERIAHSFPVALIDEFQDTDLAQFRIFDAIYAQRPECALFLIGDPKQAIYGFRGADIFTYMRAKRATAPGSRYTLDTNWRSSGRLIGAVNTLFEQSHAPFLYAGAIDFQAVAAAGRADEKALLVDGETPAPLVAWLVARDGSTKPISKTRARERLPTACAGEIARLLTLGAEGRARIGDEPIRPRDLAVLVRDHREAQAVQAALRAAGIASVYYSRESVFESGEAQALERLLAAVADPGNEGLLRAALCDGLVQLTAADLDALLRDEIAWEEQVHRFHGYLEVWQLHGFMAMFRRLLHEQAIPPRLLALDDGERRLTNLLQLAELLQNASRDRPGFEPLLRWFAERRREPDGNSEEQQLRLESDEALVKIVTVHRSKGLEYPIVFLPFLWGCKVKDDGPVLFHQEDSEAGSVLHLAPESQHRALAERERVAEEVRLVYVALTRARHRCYFAWGAFKDAERSGLAWLLHADAASASVGALAERVAALSDDQLRGRLETLGAASGNALVVEALPQETTPLRAETAIAERLDCRTPARSVRWAWRVASYSGLTAGRFEAAGRPDYGSLQEDAEGNGANERDRFRFPKGTRAGVFLHQLLEKIDFPAARGPALPAEVRRQLLRHGFDAAWQEPVARWLGEVFDTPIDAADGLTLRAVARSRRLDELEFHYPMAAVAPGAIEQLLGEMQLAEELLRSRRAGRAGADQPDLFAQAAGQGPTAFNGPRLSFQPLDGIMRGFIDLVFEHEGRFYLADYKSSWLGPRFDDYTPVRLAQAIAAHRYDLQYLIYALALHRYLRLRRPGYDFDQHFGGVYYLFLRGMTPQRPGSGVHFARPARAVIERFDHLTAGGRP